MFPEGRIMDFLIVGVIALIVVGPKDLPVLMRKVGQFVGKMRGMAAEFRASFEELARQSELDDLRREVEAMRISQQTAISQLNPMIDPQTTSVLRDIDQHLAPPPTAIVAPEQAAAEAASAPILAEPLPAPLKAKAKPKPRAAPRARQAVAPKTARAAKSPSDAS